LVVLNKKNVEHTCSSYSAIFHCDLTQTAEDAPSDVNSPDSITIGTTSEVIPEQNEVSDVVVYDQTPTIKSQKFHIVARGETLGSISLKYYGSSGKWKKIYDNNRDIIKDPNSLRPVTKLMIPE